LADAAARAGVRVLLIEINLRRPTLARQLGIRPDSGLGDVLAGTIPMDAATQPVALAVPSDDMAATRTLDVLTAGDAHLFNPAELIESGAMDAVLERARSDYDLVLIDAPPLTAVSDAFPLLPKSDGIVMVGAIGHDRSDVAERLRQTLTSSGALLLGVVANRSGSRNLDLLAYDSFKGHSSSPDDAQPDGVSSRTEPHSTATT
jgi:Mrp family chromosome partitioning ATPase